MTQPQQPQVQVQVAAHVVQAPDNSRHVSIVIAVGPLQTTLVVPHAVAGQLADQLAAQVKTAAEEARRQDTGLVIPTAQLPGRLTAGNGHR